MKIRTDFVTNSSSSSFCVEIEVELNDGSRYSVETKASEYGSNSNLNCDAQQIMSAASVDDLSKLLKKSMSGTGKNKIKEFADTLSKEIADIGEVDNITLRRIFTAWGEASSCQIQNDEKLIQLARNLVAAKGIEEKKTAQDTLIAYLDSAEVYVEGGWQDSWPTEFCGEKPVPRYNWRYLELAADKLAKKIADEKLRYDDLAVETCKIDLKEKTVDSSADYMIDCKEKRIGLKPTARSSVFYRNVLSDAFSDYQILENTPVKELFPDCNVPCSNPDFVLYKDSAICLVIAIKTEENGKTNSFKELSKQCEKAGYAYLLLANDKDNNVSKILKKVKEVLFKDLYDTNCLDSLPPEAKFTEITQEGEGKLVTVKFADGRAYPYNCFAPILVGSIVHVCGARKGIPGKVIEIFDESARDGYFSVIEIME